MEGKKEDNMKAVASTEREEDLITRIFGNLRCRGADVSTYNFLSTQKNHRLTERARDRNRLQKLSVAQLLMIDRRVNVDCLTEG